MFSNPTLLATSKCNYIPWHEPNTVQTKATITDPGIRVSPEQSTWINVQTAILITNIYIHVDSDMFPFNASEHGHIAAIVNIKYQAISILFNHLIEARIQLYVVEYYEISADDRLVVKLLSEGKIKVGFL